VERDGGFVVGHGVVEATPHRVEEAEVSVGGTVERWGPDRRGATRVGLEQLVETVH
jgi:hypothetical protein